MNTRKAKLKIMWDYSAFPVWIQIGNQWAESANSLEIDNRLRQKLERWSNEWSVLLAGCDSSSWTPPDPEVRHRWVEDGRTLALLLALAVGSNVEVYYYDDESGTTELISSPGSGPAMG